MDHVTSCCFAILVFSQKLVLMLYLVTDKQGSIKAYISCRAFLHVALKMETINVKTSIRCQSLLKTTTTGVVVMECFVFRNTFTRCIYIHELFKKYIVYSTLILRNLYSFIA